MPQLTPYHLTFHGGLHVGAGVENLNTSLTWVPSDTLWSAILSTWHLMGRSVADIVPNENSTPPFRLTSSFPFVGGVRFYPMPVDLRSVFSDDTLRAEGAGKTIRRIRYLSEKLFRLALSGTLLDAYRFSADENKEPKEGLALQGGEFWLHRSEVPALPERFRKLEDGKVRLLRALRHQKVWQKSTVPRVTVHRVSSASELFQVERIVFEQGCGLWFGVEGEFEGLDTIIKLLGENGLGGERSVGYGTFTAQEHEILSLPDVTGKSRAFLLSRWHPRQDEVAFLKAPNAAYRLVSIGGYLHTWQGAAQRRKRITLVSEGSLLPMSPQGDAPDVRPTYSNLAGDIPHPVYRVGFAVACGWPTRGG